MAGFRQAGIDVKELAKNLNMDVPTVYDAVTKSRRGGILRLWTFEDKGKFGQGRLTATVRRKDGSGYDKHFQQSYVSFFGSAYEKVKQLTIDEHHGVGVVILECEVRSRYDAAAQKEYTNYYVYDLEVLDDNQQQPAPRQQPAQRQQTARRPAPQPVDDFDDELPF